MNQQKTIVISGSTGLIGSNLRKYFESNHWKVIPLGRKDFEQSTEILSGKVNGTDAVLHFSGAPIIRRWTKKYREEIYNSRIHTTRKLVDAIRMAKTRPDMMVSAAAVGIYNQECVQDEYSNQYDKGFIGKLCMDWEAEAEKASELTRFAIVRLGIVLTKQGGALKTMLPAFRLGLGGKIASGRQPFAWIHLDDVISAVEFLVLNKETSGIYNLVAPGLINNMQFTAALGKTLKRPVWFTIPATMLRMAFGDAASTLTGGQKVVPIRLEKAGFQFKFPEIHQALKIIFK